MSHYGYHFPVNFDQNFNHSLTSQTVTVDRAIVEKLVVATAVVDGNIGKSDAKADAFGYNSLAETVNTSWSIEDYGSGAYGSSVSASDANGYYYMYGA